MRETLEQFIVYTASGLAMWFLKDIATTNRAIWKEFRRHSDRLAVLEGRCEANHDRRGKLDTEERATNKYLPEGMDRAES